MYKIVIDNTASILVAMAPLNEAEIRLYAQIYHDQHPKAPSLSPNIEETLVNIGRNFDDEWNPLHDSLMKDGMDRRQVIENLREERLKFERQKLLSAWEPVIETASKLRTQVYEDVFIPIITREERLSSQWLVRKLRDSTQSEREGDIHTEILLKSQKKVTEEEMHEVDEERVLSKQTLNRWRSRGLLLNDRYGHPDFDSATSIFMMQRLRPNKPKGFLPSGSYKGMPIMYCYRQDSPTSPTIACGLPLDKERESLPKHAFLYSPLSSLAYFHRDWLPFNGWSVRWAGTTYGANGELLWDLSEEEIARWDPEVRAYERKIMGEAQFTRHTLANLTLLTWASQLINHKSAYQLPTVKLREPTS